MKLIILIPIILLSGCFRIATTAQDNIFKQSLADSNAAALFVESTTTDEGIKIAAAAIRNHGSNMAKAMEIVIADLPTARVNVSDWIVDPYRANEQTSRNLERDEMSIATMVTATTIATILAGVGLRMAASSLYPMGSVGQLVNFISMLFGNQPVEKRKAFAAIIEVLDSYKDLDPNWRDNILYKMLADKMTDQEKTYIKKARNELG